MTLKPLADLADAMTPPPRASDALGRSEQLFTMVVRAKRGAELREAMVSGRDIYTVTAPLVVEACVRLLDGLSRTWAGVRTPGEIFDARDFLETLGDVLTPTPITGSSAVPSCPVENLQSTAQYVSLS